MAPPPARYSSEKSAPNRSSAWRSGKILYRRTGRSFQAAKILRTDHPREISTTCVIKDGEVKTTISITILVLMMSSSSGDSTPAGDRLVLRMPHVFTGPDFGKDAVTAMDAAANTAEHQRSVMDGQSEASNNEWQVYECKDAVDRG